MTRTGWQKTWVRIVTTALTVMVMIIIFGFSTEDAERSDLTSGVISETVLHVFHPEYEEAPAPQKQELYDRVQFIVRKCAHFTEYMILGFMLRLCLESWFGHRTRNKRILALAGLVLGAAYAGTDEQHQLAIEGRSGQWTDVLVDSCGVLAGVLIGSLAVKAISRRMNGR